MSKVGTSLARAQSWHEYCMGQPVDNLWITIGTTLACPKLARVLLVLQHFSALSPELAWVLHGVQQVCQHWKWHGFCMRCNIRARSKVGMGFAWVQHSCQHEARPKLARVLHGVQHVCQCASWHRVCRGKLGLTSVWAYVGPYSAKHNTRHNTRTSRVFIVVYHCKK
jgi:hypothetical protein